MNNSSMPFLLTVIIGLAIISMATLFATYTAPEQKQGAALSVIEKSAAGYVLVWENGIGPTPMLASQRMRDISAGGRHACALSMQDETFCWGDGASGQLGNGGFRSSSSVERAGAEKWQAIAAGKNHTCGISADGMTLCWGEGTSGQLGNDDYANRASPVPVRQDPGFIALSAGENHTCGISAEGLASCWGGGEHGQIGDGGREPQSRPAAVAGDIRFIDISAGHGHTCALSLDGTVWCWGKGSNGQLGNGSTDDSEIPASVISTMAFKAIAAGDGYSCALTNSGEAWCWGGMATSGHARPFLVDKGPFQQLSAAETHACGLKGGGIWCFRMGPAKRTGFLAGKKFGETVHITPADRFRKISTRGEMVLSIVK